MKLDCRNMGPPEARTGILFLHGFGANMFDLCDLAGSLDPRQQGAWYFPQAPYTLPCPGYAWFPADGKDREAALYGSYFADLEQLDDPGRLASLEALETLCLSSRHEQWIVGGFSQGSMMALHLAARSRIPVKSLILFSSAPFALQALEEELDRQPPAWNVLQTHGLQDPILTINQARKLHSFLAARKIKNEYLEFNGYHQIPESALVAAAGLVSAGLY